MLVRAFDDDPVANYMFAGYRRRLRGLHSFFSTELQRHYLPHGHVYTTDDLSGAALWGPPDRERHPVQELLELLPTAPYLLSPHVLGALRLMFTVEGLHPKEPHWYLFTWAPRRSARARAWARLFCAPCSVTSTWRASAHTSSPPKSGTCPFTPASVSRSSMCSRRRGAVLPYGECGENPDLPSDRGDRSSW